MNFLLYRAILQTVIGFSTFEASWKLIMITVPWLPDTSFHDIVFSFLEEFIELSSHHGYLFKI